MLAVAVRDVMVPGELKRAYASVLAARKDGEAALERARGETASLRNLANAARLLDDSPGLLRLRALQEVGQSSGNTIMLGLDGGPPPPPPEARARRTRSTAPIHLGRRRQHGRPMTMTEPAPAPDPSAPNDDSIPVLDHGFVRLDASMADDLSVVNAARVSFARRRTEMSDADAGLIRFLMRDRHGTPFEHNSFRFHIRCPMFVAREWMRHRVGSFNEFSLRYAKATDDFYVPDA